MSTLLSTELCLLNFLEDTADVVDWYMLGVYMNLPSKELSHIEKQFSSQGSARCKTEFIRLWIPARPNGLFEIVWSLQWKNETDTQCLVGSDCLSFELPGKDFRRDSFAYDWLKRQVMRYTEILVTTAISACTAMGGSFPNLANLEALGVP